MKFHIKVYISSHTPLPIIFTKQTNCVSLIVSDIMHLFINFISYLGLFFCFSRMFDPELTSALGDHCSLRLELGNYASSLVSALKRQAHVPYNSSIVTIKVPEHWPLWEAHLPGIARQRDAKAPTSDMPASICNVKFVNKSQLSLTDPDSSCSERVY